jgi:unsaturated chondroitin disaccharide hydrolase
MSSAVMKAMGLLRRWAEPLHQPAAGWALTLAVTLHCSAKDRTEDRGVTSNDTSPMPPAAAPGMLASPDAETTGTNSTPPVGGSDSPPSSSSTEGTPVLGNPSTPPGAAMAAGSAGSGAMPGESGAGGASAEMLGGTSASDAAFCSEQLTAAATTYEAFRTAYTDPTQIPRSAGPSGVRLVSVNDWTSGFVAGTFWRLFEHTADQLWREVAETWTTALEGQRLRTQDHDIGFIINNTFGNGYRLTGNTAYRDVLQTAAASLSTRWSATVGAIRSWDFGSYRYPVIIDNMMNLELLLSATELGGEARFTDIALAHARTTLANHFRADASSYHVVDYDSATGAIIRKQTNQGLFDESAWARGQAWGLYGFTMMHRKTLDSAFLDQALRIAEFYTSHPNMPVDGIPFFDFDAPVGAPRDASAGAIAASSLFELARYAPPEAGERYRAFAVRAVRSLASPTYRAAAGTNGQFLLMHSTGNYPINDEVDVAINYADYYYVEALLRCSGR